MLALVYKMREMKSELESLKARSEADPAKSTAVMDFACQAEFNQAN